MRIVTPSLLGFALALALAGEARADITDYFKNYQPGLEYTVDRSASTLDYDAPLPPSTTKLPANCTTPSSTTTMHCKPQIAEPDSVGWGLFAQEAFQRQGLLYFSPGLGFKLVTLNGAYDQAKELAKPGADTTLPPAPLEKATLKLYGLDAKGYLQFGLTPRYLPDFLLSLGLGAQAAVGEINVMGATERFGALLPLAYYELEFVWARFGAGALSTYVSIEGDAGKKQLLKKPIKGMSHFALSQSSESIGLLKLVLPWPTF